MITARVVLVDWASPAKYIIDMEVKQTTFRSASGQVKVGQNFIELLAEK